MPTNQDGSPTGGTPDGSGGGGQSALELAAMQQLVNPNEYKDPELQQKATAMNAKFTQTQQVLNQSIRENNEWKAQQTQHQSVHDEHQWMVNNPQIRNYLTALQSGQVDQNDPNGMRQANSQGQNGQQAPAGNQSPGVWNNLPDPMTDPDAFGSQLQQGINSMMEKTVANVVTSAMNEQVAPILRELTNRETSRSSSEQATQFDGMNRTYKDWQQVEPAVKAKLEANPNLSLPEAYKLCGDGVTHQEAARSNLTPASGVQRHADGGPKNPKSFDSTLEYMSKQMQEMSAPMPQGLQQQPLVPGAQH